MDGDFVAAYLKWPKSPWYVLVFADAGKLTGVDTMHVNYIDVRPWTPDAVVSASLDSTQAVYAVPEDELAELLTCFQEIARDYKLSGNQVPLVTPLVEPAAFVVSGEVPVAASQSILPPDLDYDPPEF